MGVSTCLFLYAIAPADSPLSPAGIGDADGLEPPRKAWKSPAILKGLHDFNGRLSCEEEDGEAGGQTWA